MSKKKTPAKTKSTAKPKTGASRKGARATTEAAAPTPRAGKRKAAEATAVALPTGPRRWKDLSTEELQALYTEKVGRPSSSGHRAYLIWKIREAEAGRVPVGPRVRKVDGPATAVTILFTDSTLESLDQVAERDGFSARLPYLRTLLREALTARDHTDVADLIVA